MRDFDTALNWTDKAFRLLDQSVQPLYLKKITLAELKKRQDRLYRKLQSRQAQTNPDEHEEERDEQS